MTKGSQPNNSTMPEPTKGVNWAGENQALFANDIFKR
jgi:hypothetical protein